jgi:hypothetical protein
MLSWKIKLIRDSVHAESTINDLFYENKKSDRKAVFFFGKNLFLKQTEDFLRYMKLKKKTWEVS